MEKEKCLVPSVISLHVRAVDQNDKDSLKNLLNLPDNNNNRKFSYNLVRIYNTGYSVNRSKPVNENLPPYLSNVNSKSHILSSALINSKFNAFLKKTNSDCNSLYQNCRLSNSNHYWSNSFKNNQTNVSPVCQNVAPSTPETDLSKPPNIIINATSLTSNRLPNEFITQKTSNSLSKKKPCVIVKSEIVHETASNPNQYTLSKSPKLIENIYKIPPIHVRNTSPSSQIEIPPKNQNKKFNISTDKLTPKRSTSSLLIPIKERPPTDSMELIALSPIRSHTLITKLSNSSQKSVPSSQFMNCVEPKKYAITSNEIPQKSAQPCLFSRINNSQSIFISNNQPFLYPDPCDSESTLSFLSRLSELSSYVSETVRWEKNRNSRRRCRPQTEIIIIK